MLVHCLFYQEASSVRSLSRLRGRVGEGVGFCTRSLVACPLPVPPPQAGEGTQEPRVYPS
jgi:hypothetical protein